MATEEDVRRISLSLPETAEKPYQRLPGFRVKGKLFARIRQKPDALMVGCSDVLEKEALIAAEPEKFFQTPHYEGYPAVLVHLEAIEADELEELLTNAWLLLPPSASRQPSKRSTHPKNTSKTDRENAISKRACLK